MKYQLIKTSQIYANVLCMCSGGQIDDRVSFVVSFVRHCIHSMLIKLTVAIE